MMVSERGACTSYSSDGHLHNDVTVHLRDNTLVVLRHCVSSPDNNNSPNQQLPPG